MSIDIKNKRIVISKVNQIGDVLFALPIATALKQHEPSCTIIFLGRAYTKALIEHYKDVDEFEDWELIQKQPDAEQITAFKKLKADIFIHVHPQKAIARLAKKAGIPIRIGTSHRLYHWLSCNRWVGISRKKSDLHETQLDMQLLKPFGISSDYTLEAISKMRHFTAFEGHFPALDLLDKNKFNLILHPLTRGRHIEWPLAMFAELIKALDPNKFNIFVTGSPAEGEEIRPHLITPFKHVHDLCGKISLDELMHFISEADGMICASTGPVHLAAAFGKHTLGLYAPIKPFHAGRWGPVGPRAQTLFINKNCSDCRDLSRCICIGLITVGQVKTAVEDWLKPETKVGL